jgi:hypothetical protein
LPRPWPCGVVWIHWDATRFRILRQVRDPSNGHFRLDLLAGAVCNLIRAGIPEKIAMQISGHKTASRLWRYNIIDARDIQEAGKRTERYLEAQKGQQHAELPTEYFGTKPS